MSTDLMPDTDEVTGTDVPPPMRHAVRRSEQRFDGTVETLCGLIRQPAVPKPGRPRCPKCLEVLRAIRELEAL